MPIYKFDNIRLYTGNNPYVIKMFTKEGGINYD